MMKLFHLRGVAGTRFCALTAGVLLFSGALLAQEPLAEGKKLFSVAVPACAICHTLKHAGAVGEVGPSLDELRPDAARVEKALRNGIGQMPAFASLTEAQIKLLASYVAGVAGKTP